MDMMKQAQRAVKKSSLGTAEIASKARVSQRWVQLLLAGGLKNPSYKRLLAVLRVCEAPTDML
jgi:hypothetical protein